ncbi:hypothetical protein Goklo_028437, partial [Gossypium klotzschianum]|nr:hypothetical protein [Gossypium klotzschianum]
MYPDLQMLLHIVWPLKVRRGIWKITWKEEYQISLLKLWEEGNRENLTGGGCCDNVLEGIMTIDR